MKHAHIDRDFYVGDEAWVHSDALKITRVIKNGVVQDWDDFKKVATSDHHADATPCSL